VETRILYWNIQKFGHKKIGKATPSTVGAAQDRWRVIESILSDATPDIFVIVEVTKGIGGTYGASTVLRQLRNNLIDPDADQWRMVPLQIVGKGTYREYVAVYYKGISKGIARYFTGPFVWTSGAKGMSDDPATGVSPSDYPPAIAKSLQDPKKTSRTIPNTQNVLYRQGKVETQSAARIKFDMQPKGTSTTLPSYGNSRQPFMVTFYEQDSSGFRNITLFSIHAPPLNDDAVNFVNKILRYTAQITSAPNIAKNEIKVICGDFNLNTLSDNGSKSINYSYLETINSQPAYTSLNSPSAGTIIPSNELEAYQGYFTTHINYIPKNTKKKKPISAKSRFMWSDNSNPMNEIDSKYPAYRYLSSVKTTPNTYAVDNILVWRATGTNKDFTIMNPIIGTPFNDVTPPPSSAPIGGIKTQMQFTSPPTTWPQAPNAGDFDKTVANTLVSWGNYGKIRDTSDHLPLFVIV